MKRPHAFEPFRRAKRATFSLAWLYCRRCGLVLLRNAATRAAERASCPGEDP